MDFYEPLIFQNLLGEYYIKYWKIADDTTAETICSNIRWIIQEYHLDEQSTIVLSQSIKILRDVEAVYKNGVNTNVTTTFETKSDIDPKIPSEEFQLMCP